MNDDVAQLEELNRGYVSAAERCDVGWYAEHLAPDFMAGNPDGSLTGKTDFLARFKQPIPGSQFAPDDVRVRILGDVALIHSGFRHTRADGKVQLGRYTDIWQRRGNRWLCVAAQFAMNPAV
jgi:ketosteroid isomerase-like protein